ncbi:MAG TPA: response regulator [Gemmatimonadales bacterium]|nr:response regulator [Gemmatimonadales bacterium]
MTRVLIVDDKEDNLYYLQALLTGHGCTVTAARHGAEALVLARQAPPELVISDLLMPVMDGYTLLRYWKADARLKVIPFVVYTATYTEAEDERLAMNLGADAFILKPAEPDAFIARIREVQANATAAAPTPPKHPVGDEKELLKVYSESLIRKLEEKTLQLEDANRALQLDITERRAAEEKLRESEERFRATFEQAAVGIAHVAADGRFLRVNDKFCEITGYPHDELLQRTFLELTTPEDRAEGDDARRAMLAGTLHAYSSEKRYHRKDGRLLWGSVVTTLLRDAAGQPKYFISVLSDITERKLLQQQFLRAQRMESIGTLAGGIAHDLNNLLSPIVMGVGLLKLNRQTEADARIIDTIERSAQRGANLVKQVLSFARGVEGARVAVHLSHLTHEIQEFVHSTFPKNITFRVTVPKDTWLVQGDPTQLNQVVLNLCVNARDAMPGGGTLSVSTCNVTVDDAYAALLRTVPAGRYVQLQVTDTGTGIPPEVRDRIFEPFFTTKEPGKGTGLGLSTVQTIVRSHGGGISVESEPGRGTSFKIFLPVPTDTPVGGALEPAAKAPPRGQGELILVVDDDASVLDITRQTLESYGYRVLSAEDGAQAIGHFAMHRDQIALVLTDMMMPVMDGLVLIKALRRISSGVCIIATSGHQDNVDPATRADVQHHLAKPYSADTLLQVLRQALDERRTSP